MQGADHRAFLVRPVTAHRGHDKIEAAFADHAHQFVIAQRSGGRRPDGADDFVARAPGRIAAHVGGGGEVAGVGHDQRVQRPQPYRTQGLTGQPAGQQQARAEQDPAQKALELQRPIVNGEGQERIAGKGDDDGDRHVAAHGE